MKLRYVLYAQIQCSGANHIVHTTPLLHTIKNCSALHLIDYLHHPTIYLTHAERLMCNALHVM